MENIYQFTQEQLQHILNEWKEPAFRTVQIFNWLYKKKVSQFNQMRNLPASIIEKLNHHFTITLPEKVATHCSKDGTSKILLKLYDGYTIETVHIPEPKRDTVCISSQIGCPFKCLYCVTGHIGFVRNLNSDEIIGQLMVVLNSLQSTRKINLVFMGMGEPLLNLKNVMHTLEIMTNKNGLGLSRRSITLSTAGYLPGLAELRKEKNLPKLALSVNSADTAVRTYLMPINDKNPLNTVIEYLQSITLKKGKRFTLEYVMIKDINDGIPDAQKLVKLVKKIPAKVNLIPLNENPLLPFKASDYSQIEVFASFLRKHYITVTIRKSRGQDIAAACGLLTYLQ